MGNTLGTLITFTTYGTCLRGDRRGWVENGITFPADPPLEEADRHRMKHPVFLFPQAKCLDIGTMIGESLTGRLQVPIYALTVGTWHVHIVIGPTAHHISEVTKCAKDAARYGLRPGRPIWTDGFDKRYCFDPRALTTRIRYVERHNEAIRLPASPYAFITAPPLHHTL
ncbi:MAG: hypothetical protein WD669_02835 [Pirellulales bacterium]